jgi:hypothetical protein
MLPVQGQEGLAIAESRRSPGTARVGPLANTAGQAYTDWPRFQAPSAPVLIIRGYCVAAISATLL